MVSFSVVICASRLLICASRLLICASFCSTAACSCAIVSESSAISASASCAAARAARAWYPFRPSAPSSTERQTTAATHFGDALLAVEAVLGVLAFFCASTKAESAAIGHSPCEAGASGATRASVGAACSAIPDTFAPQYWQKSLSSGSFHPQFGQIIAHHPL